MPLSVEAGNRIRVTAPYYGLDLATLTVVAVSPEAITGRPDGSAAEQRILLSQVIRMDVWRGTRGQGWRGLRIGALGGGLLGVISGAISGDDQGGLIAMSAGEKAFVGAVVLGSVGGPLGALLGSQSQVDVWDTLVPPPANMVTPTSFGSRRTPAVAVQLRWMVR